MKTDNEHFNVGDLVTFDDGSYIGLVIKIWCRSSGSTERYATVVWNDGDRTDEIAFINGGCVMYAHEYDWELG